MKTNLFIFSIGFAIICSASLIFAQKSNDLIISKVQYSWEKNVLILTDSSVSVYDKNDNLLEYKNFNNEGSVKGLNNDKIFYTYDKNNNLLSEISYVWDEDKEQFIERIKKAQNFDKNNNRIMVSIENKKNNQAAIISTNYFYTYDSNKNVLTETRSVWNEENKKMIIDYQLLYGYDLKNNEIERIYSTWNEDAKTVKGVEKVVQIYNSNNKLEKRISQDWDEINQFFYKSGNQRLYVYDIKNNLLSDEEYRNNVKYSISYYTYDVNNNLISEEIFHMNNQSNTYTNSMKTIYTYNTSNNLISKSRQWWSEDKKRYSENDLTSYTYDSRNNILTELFQEKKYKGEVLENKRLTKYYYKSRSKT